MADEKTPLKWKFETRELVVSSPAVSEGLVYFGSSDRNLYAVDINTGKEKWKFKTGIPSYMNSGISKPTVVDGVVYFGCSDNHLYAVDANTSEEKWKFKAGGRVPTDPAVVDGVVYFGSWDNHFYAVDIKAGAEKWKFEVEKSISSSPSVVDGVVYFGSYDYHLYVLDAKTGEEKWKFETGNSIISSPAVLDGVVYFGSNDNYLYALDTKTGEEKWKFETVDVIAPAAVTSPAVSDGMVYFGSNDSHFYALDTKTGEEKWKIKPGDSKSSPVVVDGIIYFWINDKKLCSVNPKSERKKKKNWKPDTEENLKKIRELMVSSEFNAGIELALSIDDQYLLLELVEGCRIGENGAITINETFKANAYVKNTNITEDEDYDILVNALFKIILKINNILKPDSSLKIENIKILDLHSFVNLPVEITAFPNLETIFIALRHDAVPDEYSAIKGLVIKKILLKRELMRAIWDKVGDDLSNQSYETEVSHQQAENFDRLEADKFDSAYFDSKPCPCGSGELYEDCDGVEKVRIPSGEYIMEDEEFDKEFFNYVNTDELGSGVLSKKEIEDWIDESVPTLVSSYESLTVGGSGTTDNPIFLQPDWLIFCYSLEDLNPKWTDDEYYLDDEKMEDYIKEVFSDLGY